MTTPAQATRIEQKELRRATSTLYAASNMALRTLVERAATTAKRHPSDYGGISLAYERAFCASLLADEVARSWRDLTAGGSGIERVNRLAGLMPKASADEVTGELVAALSECATILDDRVADDRLALSLRRVSHHLRTRAVAPPKTGDEV